MQVNSRLEMHLTQSRGDWMGLSVGLKKVKILPNPR
jgi:hypothetical protein